MNGFVFVLAFLVSPVAAIAQTTKADSITCYKDFIREPISFYGNPGDVFMLKDNESWKVSSGGPYEYIPSRYKNVIICPSVEKLIIGSRALSVSKLSSH